MKTRWAKAQAAKRKKRHLIFAPPVTIGCYESKTPARFANRESFESFVAATEQWACAAPSFQVYFAFGKDVSSPVSVVSVEGLLRSTDHGIDFLSITTLKGEMRFDYRESPVIQVFPNNKEGWHECAAWVDIAQRYLRPIPWWLRWRRYPIVTDVLAEEIRDAQWKLRVTWIAAILGGIFGFAGGLLSAVLTGSPQ